MKQSFKKRVLANPAWKAQYGSLLSDLEAAYAEIKPLGLARDYYNEIIGRIELFVIAGQLNSVAAGFDKEGEKGFQQALTPIKKIPAGDLYRV